MIQIAAVTITTHQCLIVCNAEITLLIVTVKTASVTVWFTLSFCTSVIKRDRARKMGNKREAKGLFVVNMLCPYISIYHQ